MACYNETKLRKGQREALDVILRRLRDGKSHTAIIMATRYGKSNLQRIATMAGIDAGLVSCGVSLSPNNYLVNQMNNNEKWKHFSNLVNLNMVPKHSRISDCVMNPTVNGENFLSVTMQFFQRNLEYWKDWADSLRRTSGKPVILFVDECQTQSSLNEWGRSVTEWQRETQCAVVLCTATAERSDGERIPGFEYTQENIEDVVITKTRPGSSERKIRVDIYGGQRSILNIEAHKTITFRDAWEEGVLCHVEPVWFDVDLDIVLNETRHGMLSGLESEYESRRALSRVLRHPTVIDGGINLFLDRLSHFRKVDAKCAGIIFCGNDMESDSETNRHAKEIERRLLRLNPNLETIIATSAEGNGVSELEKFSEGSGHVVIVKQMASLGLDISRLKVGLDLSPIRTKSALVQRMMRIATPHGQILVCAWVTPKDILSLATYQSLVKESGGEATASDLELLRSYEKDKEEGPEKPDYFATGFHGAGASDTQGNNATESELDQFARTILNVAPEVGAFLTQPELVRRMKSYTEQTGATKPNNTGNQIQALREEINNAAKSIINRRMPKPYKRSTYEDIAKEVWNRAYNVCGIPRNLELKQINDLKLLEQLLDVLNKAA